MGVSILFFVGFMNFVSNRGEVVEDMTAPATDDEAEVVEDFFENLTGSWRSTEDDKYVLVLKEDGVYQELYSDEMVDSGTWTIFTDLAAQGLDIEADFENNVYIEKRDDKTGEVLHYNVAVANEENLTITYLQGGVLNFERVR